MMLRSALVLLLAAQVPPGISRTQLLDNPTVMIARLNMAPGAREQVHTHPFSAVIVQLTPGDVEMRIGTRPETTRKERGTVDFIAAEMPHAAANVGGSAFDIVTVAIKPDRKPAGTQPPAEAPPGITRTPVLDNAVTRVVNVVFAPGSREPVHSHPYDLVVVQLLPGRMEVMLGAGEDAVKSVKDYAAGEVVFVPRDTPHAFASADNRRVELLSVAVK
jgi:quercetin dioxygenase-like cupin family protein